MRLNFFLFLIISVFSSLTFCMQDQSTATDYATVSTPRELGEADKITRLIKLSVLLAKRHSDLQAQEKKESSWGLGFRSALLWGLGVSWGNPDEEMEGIQSQLEKIRAEIATLENEKTALQEEIDAREALNLKRQRRLQRAAEKREEELGSKRSKLAVPNSNSRLKMSASITFSQPNRKRNLCH